jgi:hypothetical protein
MSRSIQINTLQLFINGITSLFYGLISRGRSYSEVMESSIPSKLSSSDLFERNEWITESVLFKAACNSGQIQLRGIVSLRKRVLILQKAKYKCLEAAQLACRVISKYYVNNVLLFQAKNEGERQLLLYLLSNYYANLERWSFTHWGCLEYLGSRSIEPPETKEKSDLKNRKTQVWNNNWYSNGKAKNSLKGWYVVSKN